MPNKIVEIVLSGGGPRGECIFGSLDALIKAGLYPQIKSLTGTSAGAMTAALAAIGMSPQQLKKMTENQNIENLMGNKTKIFGIERDGNGIFETLKKYIRENITNFFNEEIISDSDEINQLKDKDYGELTFSDLEILRTIAPLKFKYLTVTAVNRQTGEVKYFNAKNTPNVKIAEAAWASGAIPLFFKPVTIDGIEYIDGAYVRNIPTEASVVGLTDENEIKKHRDGKLIFAFSEAVNDPLHKALYTNENKLYSPSWGERVFFDNIVPWLGNIGGNKKYTEEAECDYKKLQELYPLQTIQITPNIESRDFNTYASKKEHLYYEGYFATYDYLINHNLVTSDKIYEFKRFIFDLLKNYEATNRNVSVTELFKLLSSEDIEIREQIGNLLKSEKYNQSLINTLNHVHTSTVIREIFASYLEIENNNVADFKFKFKFAQDHLHSMRKSKSLPQAIFQIKTSQIPKKVNSTPGTISSSL